MANDRTTQDLRALLKSIEDTGWDYARVELDGLTIVVSSDPDQTSQTDELQQRSGDGPVAQSRTPGAARAEVHLPEEELIPEFSLTTAVAAPAEGHDQGAVATVASPTIGLFWQSPKPGAPPFVEVGQYVTEDDTVCIVEVMKLMTQVKAGHAGTVARVWPQNGDMVEFGTPLIDISVS